MNPTAETTHKEEPAAAFEVERFRAQFPALQQTVYEQPLAYLDNAATSQKPEPVIEAIDRYYRETNSNVHRGLHYLSEKATEQYEGARERICRYIGGEDWRELIFVRGTTEGMNLVAQAYARPLLQPGDEILLSHMEHHSGIVPWQIVCEQTGAKLRVAPIDDDGQLIWSEYEKLLNEKTKVVSILHVSNALGTVNPIEDIVAKAKEAGAATVVDGAQAVPHMPVDVNRIGCDFYAFSGHKMFGPTGVGGLWGRLDLLQEMPPYQGGGDMISNVTFEETTYNEVPFKFEAGTPNIAGGIGLGAAVDWLNELDLESAMAHEQSVLEYGTRRLAELPNVRLIGTAERKTGVLSFVHEKLHPYDLAPVLDRQGVAIRTGHHCAQPVMQRFGIPATVRASIAFYNTKEDIDALVAAIGKAERMFGEA